MSILLDTDEANGLAAAPIQPRLSFLDYCLDDLLAEIQDLHFPDVQQRVTTCFVTAGPLACIFNGGSQAMIYIHQLLNWPETPREVMAYIVIHELLHLRIPPRVERGRQVQHPSDFRVAERALSQHRRQAWHWIQTNFWRCTRRRPRLERIDATANSKKL